MSDERRQRIAELIDAEHEAMTALGTTIEAMADLGYIDSEDATAMFNAFSTASAEYARIMRRAMKKRERALTTYKVMLAFGMLDGER